MQHEKCLEGVYKMTQNFCVFYFQERFISHSSSSPKSIFSLTKTRKGKDLTLIWSLANSSSVPYNICFERTRGRCIIKEKLTGQLVFLQQFSYWVSKLFCENFSSCIVLLKCFGAFQAFCNQEILFKSNLPRFSLHIKTRLKSIMYFGF